jgi:hypothetical protein
MTRKQDKKPKALYSPNSKQVRVKEDPRSFDQETPAWQFNCCDLDHEKWGWGKLTPKEVWDLIKVSLHSFETMTWHEIKKVSGGRAEGNGTNHHSLLVEKFNKEAQQRLVELKLDDQDELFSLRLNNTVRLYGIKQGRVLRFIWHDPHHGTKLEAYPTKR